MILFLDSLSLFLLLFLFSDISFFRGIWTIAGGALGSSVAKGKLETRNLVSILFCEALSIYGIIVSIIIATKVEKTANKPPSSLDYQCGYLMLGAGLIVGFANLSAGYFIINFIFVV